MDIRSLLSFLPRSRCLDLALQIRVPQTQTGVCLFADIAGFTPLGEALRQSLGARQGAEQLAETINDLVEKLAESVFHFGGDIMNFNGDAITCWFPDTTSSPDAALTAALEMQKTMREYGRVKTRDGLEYLLTVKIGMAYGNTRRIIVGEPQYGLFDFLSGQALTSMSDAQHLAKKGQIIIDPALRKLVGDHANISKAPDGSWHLFGLDAVFAPPTRLELPAELPEESLRPFFPPSVYQFLSNAVEGFVAELRNVVAAFVHFEGLDYDHDADVKIKLNQYLGIVQHLADHYGGNMIYLDYGDKGSVLMVLFGAPVAHDEDAVRAVSWALALQNAVKAHSFITSQRIGISRGPAYVGPLGARTRRSYTAMGDEVTAASRLMQACQPGQILVSQQVEQACARHFVFHQFPGFPMKGKGEPMRVSMPVAEMPPMPQMAVVPLVGRDAEIAQMEAILGALEGGKGGVLRLHGPHGSGKTYLATSFANQAMSRGVRVLQGSSHSLGQRTPYLPWREILRGLLGIQPTWPALQQAFQIRNMLGWMLPGSVSLGPLLGDLFGFEVSNTPQTANLLAHDRKKALFTLVGDLFEKAAAQQPLLVLIEDCQWADNASCELLEALSLRTTESPLLLVVTHRLPDDPHKRILPCIDDIAELGAQVVEMNLENLPPPAAQELATRLLGGKIEDSLLVLIGERTEGNPLYIEELVQIIRETRVVRREANQWVLVRDRVNQIRLPDSIQGIVLARLDQLDEGSRLTLKVASVVGRSFEYRTVKDVHPAAFSDAELTLQFENLEARKLSQDLPDKEPPAGRFQHGVIQEVAYETLTVTQQQELHQSIAGWIESNYRNELAPLYALLAYHYERGGMINQSVDYLLKAGDQARLMYAYQEAQALYEQALKLLYPQIDTESHEIARTLVRLGLASQDAFAFKQARQYFEEAFQYWQRAGGSAAQPRKELSPRPLRLDFPYLPLTLDPALAEDVDSMAVVTQLFSGLVEQGPNLELIPNAAQRWETSEDGLTFVFHLTPDANWSDGKPLTASDFVFAWQRVLDPATESPVAHILYDIKGARACHQNGMADCALLGITALDQATLQVTLERPVGYFLSLLAHTAFLPVPEHMVLELGEAWTEPQNLVTNGYFTLHAWEQDGDALGRMILHSSPVFHACFEGNVRYVELHALADAEERANAYLNGELDVLSLRDMGDQRPRLRERFGGEYFSAPLLAVGYLGFNLNRPPFNDPAVRRAFVMAVDRDLYANVKQEGFSYPGTGGFVPPGMPGHSPDISLPFDPQAAKQLLDGAGYANRDDFPTVELICNPGAEDQIAFLAEQWQTHLGIKVAANCLPWERFDQRLKTDLPHMFIELFAADFADPDNFLASGPQQTWLAWQDAQYQSLIEKSRRAGNQDHRLESYRQADRLLIENAVLMPIKYLRSHWLFKPWIKSFPISSIQRSLWKDVQLDD